MKIKRGKEVIAKIIPVAPKKAALKVSALNELFKRLPRLGKDDQQAFEEDIKHLRSELMY